MSRKITNESVDKFLSRETFKKSNMEVDQCFGQYRLKLQELRELGIAAPAVNLCQFVDNLDGLTHTSLSTQINAGDVIVGAALQFGFSGGSSTCNICEAKEHGNMNYWISIADTCSRFAQSVQKMRS